MEYGGVAKDNEVRRGVVFDGELAIEDTMSGWWRHCVGVLRRYLQCLFLDEE